MTSRPRSTAATVGFGLERLALFSLRYPKAMLAWVSLAVAILVGCALQLQFESDTRAIFRSQSPEYAKLEQVSRYYPGLLNQVLLTVEGAELHTAPGLELLRSLHLELEFVDEVKSVVSLFSARHPPKSATETGKPFVPDPLDDSVDIGAVRSAIHGHPMIAEKLLSGDGKTALLIVTLREEIRDLETTDAAITKIRETADATLKGSKLTFAATGLAVIRTEVINSLMRDQIIFILAGIAIGLVFSYMYFKDIQYVLIANIPVAVSISGLLGGMWLTGQKVNVLSSMATPLITVISLASALHLTFAIRRASVTDSDLKSAITTAIMETGPGCILSALTTALALLALTIAPFPFIYNFGVVSVCGAVFALLATLLTLPAAAYLILKVWPPSHAHSKQQNPLTFFTDGLCHLSAISVNRAPWLITGIGVVALIVLGTVYLQNRPNYTSAENLPRSSEASQTMKRIDEKLAGTSSIRVLLQWPEDTKFPSVPALDVISDADNIVSQQYWITTVWSLGKVVNWAETNGLNREDSLKVVKQIRGHLNGQVLTTNPNTAMITGYFPDTNSIVLLPRLQTLQADLNVFRKKWPEVRTTLTGASTLEAITSSAMIKTLNWSLLSAIGLIIVLITVALRSLRAGAISILPNLLPIAAGGTYLYVTQQGLQFTSVVAFTVGFGIAVDSTIHYLNHYRMARNEGLNTQDAITRTTMNVGPVLIITTILVSASLGATILSDLPMVQLYGKVSIIVLTTALIADLLVLPAIITVLERGTESAQPASTSSA